MKLILIACLLFLTTNAFTQSDCAKFKNGVFKITDANFVSVITRNGSTQTEVVNGDKSTTLTFVVNWINGCTYTLKPTAETLKKMPGMPADATLTVEIIKANENSYLQTSTSNFSDVKATCEVFNVKEGQ